MDELKPCPWCGEAVEDTVIEGSTFRWRMVAGCCTSGPEVRHNTLADDQVAAEAQSRADAIAAWNRRQTPAYDAMKLALHELMWINSDVWPLVHGLTSRETVRERFRKLPAVIETLHSSFGQPPVDEVTMRHGRDASRLLHGFMLDTNSIGLTGAAENLYTGIKHVLDGNEEP